MKIHAIGGYNEVGKNMTVVECGDDAFIFDCGIFMPAIVGVEEKERTFSEEGLRDLGALPDDLYLERKKLKNKIRAFLLSHAHLDHIGAIPFIAENYDADIIGSPFTIEVLKTILEDSNKTIKNRLIQVNLNSHYIMKGKRDYKVEFINITHSTPHTTAIALHTPEGIVLYVNDYKLDNSPVLGDKTNYKRLKELSKIGISVLIIDCLYSAEDRKTPSEKIARGLLEDVLFGTYNQNSGILVTTFSSHIARLKSITEFGRRLNRKVVFLGRSLNKYMVAAERTNIAPFAKDAERFTFKNQLEKIMKKINARKKDYLVVCTGHQGEPGSILDRISRNALPLNLSRNDQVIFSSKTIPTPVNEENKEQLERRLKKHHVRIFDNVHISGHGAKEDLRDFIQLTNPKCIIPSHGDLRKLGAGARVAEEMGYKIGKNVYIMQNGRCVEI